MREKREKGIPRLSMDGEEDGRKEKRGWVRVGGVNGEERGWIGDGGKMGNHAIPARVHMKWVGGRGVECVFTLCALP